MLTGVAACAGTDVLAVFNKKANEDPPPVRTLRSEVPVDVERLLIQAMARRPDGRHANMAALKDEVMRCLARIEATPAPPGSPRRTEPGSANTKRVWHPPPRALWITAAGALAGLSIAAVVVLRRTDTNVGHRSRTAAVAVRPVPAVAPAPVVPAAPALPTSTVRPARTPAALSAPAVPANTTLKRPTAATAVDIATPKPKPTPTELAPAPTATRPVAASKLPASKSSGFHPAGLLAKTGDKTGGVAGGVTGSAARAPAPDARPDSATARIAGATTEALARGRAAFAKGNFPEAVRFGRSALAGDAVGGHLLLGDSFYKMERFADALAEYNAALKLAPANPQARRGRELAIRQIQQR
jgi:hypothetical protein